MGNVVRTQFDIFLITIDCNRAQNNFFFRYDFSCVRANTFQPTKKQTIKKYQNKRKMFQWKQMNLFQHIHLQQHTEQK